MARDKNLRPCLPLKPQEKVEDNQYIYDPIYKLITNWLLERRLDDEWGFSYAGRKRGRSFRW